MAAAVQVSAPTIPCAAWLSAESKKKKALPNAVIYIEKADHLFSRLGNANGICEMPSPPAASALRGATWRTRRCVRPTKDGMGAIMAQAFVVLVASRGQPYLVRGGAFGRDSD